VFLNGAILGMTKKEITSKIEEIINFSGCERYIDTPVKRYSSGMTVRLAFAVAAFLEPEIVVIDEVLAVGDAEFQKKAIGKMQDISRGEGRTVLFVSHNMAAVKNLCTRGILLEKGKVAYTGNINNVIDVYLSSGDKYYCDYYKKENKKNTGIKSVRVKTSTNSNLHDFNECLKVEIELSCETEIKEPAVSYQILNSENFPIIHELLLSSEIEFCNQKGSFIITSTIEKLKLYQGRYKLNVYFADNFTKISYDKLIEICDFEIVNKNKRPYYWANGSAIYKEDNTNWKVVLKDE